MGYPGMVSVGPADYMAVILTPLHIFSVKTNPNPEAGLDPFPGDSNRQQEKTNTVRWQKYGNVITVGVFFTGTLPHMFAFQISG
jgi:hypothetical protein